MKKLSFLHSVLATLALAATLTSCSKDDDNNDSAPQEPAATYHYDLTVVAGNHGGMSKDKSHITLSVASLNDATATISFEGKGAEITDYTMENIYDGKYYYQVPISSDRFSKLQFKGNKMQVVQEQKFKENTYKSRNYTHAWLSDNTLIIMSTDGEHKKVIWTKLNTNDMTIIGEGTLPIEIAEGYNVLTTSGVLTYRKSDNKLFYFYYNKKETSGSNKTTNEPFFFDENDNLYISAFSAVSKKNIGKLLRIKKGAFDFEEGYNAFPEAKGKLLTVQYLGNGKALAYSGDNAVGSSIGDVAYYYSIIDVNSKRSTRLAYNGTEIPYSSGSFSQRSVYNANEKKAYIGVNTADEQCIYIYDVATSTVTKGASIAAGYYFDQIRLFQD